MFNANRIRELIDSVDSYDALVRVLAENVAYTFGDRFTMGNYKVGSSAVQPDEAHSGWVWQPIAGTLYTMARCNLAPIGTDVLIFASGIRARTTSKSVLCIYDTSTSDTLRSRLAQVLAKTDGATTIGAKLADALGYTDWAVLKHSGTSADNWFSAVTLDVSGAAASTGSWIAYVSLDLPDDNQHSYTTEFDIYSGVMVMDYSIGVPTAIFRQYDATLTSAQLMMSKSTYDADYQNTVDIVHQSIAASVAQLDATTQNLAETNQGLITANGAIYAALADSSIFGAKFKDVVEAWQRIEACSQYIPRP